MINFKTALHLCLCVLLVTSFGLQSWSNDDVDGIGPLASENLITDTEYLSQMAEAILEEVEAEVAEKPSMEDLSKLKKAIRKASYLTAQTSAFTEAILKAAFIKYPDVLQVRIGIEVVSFFILTPAFIYTGHSSWLVPLHAPGVGTSTTLIYLLTRKWMEKRFQSKRFQMSPAAIEKFKNSLYTNDEVKDINIHILPADVGGQTLPVGREGLRNSIMNTLKKNKPVPYGSEYISLKELEEIINNPDFLNSARTLNLDSSLFEELLIQKILSEPSLKEPFLARVNNLSLRQGDQWGAWTRTTESFLNRIRAEAMLQNAAAAKALGDGTAYAGYAFMQGIQFNFGDSKIMKDGAVEYFKVYWKSIKDRKSIYKKIRELELFQLDTLAALLRNENPDQVKATHEFEIRRQSLLDALNTYEAKYPAISHPFPESLQSRPAMSCEDLFAHAN